MSLLDITVQTGLGIGESRLSIDLGDGATLEISVTSQTDRFRRVRAAVHGRGARVDVLSPTYIDMRDRVLRTPEVVAQVSPRRMHAHTLHGGDVRAMLDAGTYSYERGAIRS